MTGDEALRLVQGQPVGTIIVFQVAFPWMKTGPNDWEPMRDIKPVISVSGNDQTVANSITPSHEYLTAGAWVFM